MDPVNVLAVGGMGVVFLVLMCLAVSVYQRCPPNQAMIVYGAAGARIIKGGGSPVWPMIEQRAFISLEVMRIELKNSAPYRTIDGVNVLINAVAQVKVCGDEESIKLAAEQFLGKSDNEIVALAHELLVGQLRATAVKLPFESLARDFDSVSSQIQHDVIPGLAKLGMTIVSLTLTDLTEIDDGKVKVIGNRIESEPSAAFGKDCEPSDRTGFASLVDAVYAHKGDNSNITRWWLSNKVKELTKATEGLINCDRAQELSSLAFPVSSKDELLKEFGEAERYISSLSDPRLRKIGQEILGHAHEEINAVLAAAEKNQNEHETATKVL